jgi:hypothetical protein
MRVNVLGRAKRSVRILAPFGRVKGYGWTTMSNTTHTRNEHEATGTTFARRVFTGAAIYGILVLAPQYFLEGRVGQDYPPPITHPEYFYGFIGLALTWQFLFLLIGRDPVRYRAAMPVAVVEKLAFGVPALFLYAQDRLAGATLTFGLVDLGLGTLFVLSYLKTRHRSPASDRALA